MSKKIVIIDDEEDLCHLMKTFLVDLNYEVFLAHTLTSGMELVGSVHPDIVFVDNNLPDGLGWDKLDQIKSALPNSRINLMSAYHTHPKSATFSPNIGYIEKPLRLHLLKDYL